jgi:predicted DNA-binding protein (MmcQ/YjbR family)
MDFEYIKKYCLNKKGVTETYPFDDITTVFKVGTKMFALTNKNNSPLSISLKCDPFLSQDLRREYEAIKPGYHLNKTHWITVEIDGSVTSEKILWLIDLSYELVFKSLSKSEKTILISM